MAYRQSASSLSVRDLRVSYPLRDGCVNVVHGVSQHVPRDKTLALMFQDPVGSLGPRMTARRILAEPSRIHAIKSVDAERETLRVFHCHFPMG